MKKEYLFAGGARNLLEQRGADHKTAAQRYVEHDSSLSDDSHRFAVTFRLQYRPGQSKSVCRLPAGRLPAIMCHGIYGIFRLQRRLLLRPYSAERTGRLRHHLSLAAGDSDFFLFYPEGTFYRGKTDRRSALFRRRSCSGYERRFRQSGKYRFSGCASVSPRCGELRSFQCGQ